MDRDLGGLQHLDPATGAFTLCQHDPARPDSIGSRDLSALALDGNGGLWIGTWPGGLDLLPRGGKRFVHYRVDSDAQRDAKLNIVRALRYASDGRLWIGTEKGRMRLNTRQPGEARQRLPGPASQVNTLYEDKCGVIWGGTLGAGLVRRNPGETMPTKFTRRAADPASLPSNHVRGAMLDRSGMLWVATMSNGIGLANLTTSGFRRMLPFDGGIQLVSNEVQNLEGESGERMWVGGASGLALINRVKDDVLRAYRADSAREGALGSDVVYHLFQQPGGPLCGGGASGLYRLDHPDAPFHAYHVGNLARDFINTIRPSVDGSLWQGTAGEVLNFNPCREGLQAVSASTGRRWRT